MTKMSLMEADMKLAYLKIKRIPRFINKQITNIFFFVFVDFFLLIQIADAHVTIPVHIKIITGYKQKYISIFKR